MRHSPTQFADIVPTGARHLNVRDNQMHDSACRVFKDLVDIRGLNNRGAEMTQRVYDDTPDLGVGICHHHDVSQRDVIERHDAGSLMFWSTLNRHPEKVLRMDAQKPALGKNPQWSI